MPSFKLFTSLSAVCVLTACSNAPSDSDVERAYRKNVDRINDQVIQMAGGRASNGLQVKVNSVKNQACNETGKNVFTCDVKTDISGRMGRLQQTLPHRLVRSSDGWVLTQMY